MYKLTDLYSSLYKRSSLFINKLFHISQFINKLASLQTDKNLYTDYNIYTVPKGQEKVKVACGLIDAHAGVLGLLAT